MKLRKVKSEKEEEQERKIEGFGNYILHDKNNVMGILLTLSKWFTLAVSAIITYLFWIYEYTAFSLLFFVMTILSVKAVYKFYKMGGRDATKGMNANDLIFNSKYQIGDTNGNERKNDKASHGSGLGGVQENKSKLSGADNDSEREYFGSNYDIRVTESNGFEARSRNPETKN